MFRHTSNKVRPLAALHHPVRRLSYQLIRHPLSLTTTRSPVPGLNQASPNINATFTPIRTKTMLATGITIGLFHAFRSVATTIPVLWRWGTFKKYPRLMRWLTGSEGFSELIQNAKGKILPPTHPWYIRTKKITDRLVKVVGEDLKEWELIVVNDPEVQNAMIFVYTGMMDVVLAMCAATGTFGVLGPRDEAFAGLNPALEQHASWYNEDDLTVFDHTHAHSFLYTVSLNLPMIADISGRSVDMVAPLLIELPHSRLCESEADVIGLFLMAVAGYNPSYAKEFWKFLAACEHETQKQEMSKDGEVVEDGTVDAVVRILEFASTHPSHEHRALELETHEASAMEIYKDHQRVEAVIKSRLASPEVSMEEKGVLHLDHVDAIIAEVLGNFVSSHSALWYAASKK
ncbi:hypothetical protein BDR26DRAFT_873809 [Obelidium mucronatum]|nr:hypothetical protein BDR26DRAFT_873809 [Obelidium mucronatum]